MACGVLPHPREYRGQLPPLAAVKSIGRVAVLTAQRTARESHEYGRDAGSVGLSLERMEDLGDPEARHAALRVPDYCAACAGMRRSRSAASFAESVPGYFFVTSSSVARAAGYCFCSNW